MSVSDEVESCRVISWRSGLAGKVEMAETPKVELTGVPKTLLTLVVVAARLALQEAVDEEEGRVRSDGGRLEELMQEAHTLGEAPCTGGN